MSPKQVLTAAQRKERLAQSKARTLKAKKLLRDQDRAWREKEKARRIDWQHSGRSTKRAGDRPARSTGFPCVGIRWTSEPQPCTSAGSSPSTPSTHPIVGDELRALRRLQRDQEAKSPFVFTSERGAPFTTAGFARMIERAGTAAKLGFKVHPHTLRHARGYALASRGHDTQALQAYLGHRNIRHTVRLRCLIVLL